MGSRDSRRRSACGRTAIPASCCVPTNSTTSCSFTTTDTAARACRLAWGTGLMAAEFATEHQARQVAVIGCGSVGLTCGRQLQRRGFDVTIYAAAVPPNVTSNMSLAGFTPASGLVDNEPADAGMGCGNISGRQSIAYRQLQLLAGLHYGVSWLDNYSLTDELPRQGSGEGGGAAERPSLMAGLTTGNEVLQPGEHPFPTKCAIRSPQIRIEPSIYLETWCAISTLWGGHHRHSQVRHAAQSSRSCCANRSS